MKGSLTEVDVPAVLEVARQMPGGAVIRFTSPRGQGEVYVMEDQIIHATFGAQTGIDALASMIGWEEGAFEVESTSTVPQPTIKGDWNSVLLEALRQMDVMQNQPDGKESKPTSTPLNQRIIDLETVLEDTSFDDAALVSRDGLLLAATPALAEEEADLLGAVAASIFTLGMRSVHQLHRGALERSVIQASYGNIVVARVNEGVFFIGVAPMDVSLGILFAETRRATRQFAALLG